MELKIIDAAMQLINLLEQYNDTEFTEIICEAVRNHNVGLLLDLEDLIEE